MSTVDVVGGGHYLEVVEGMSNRNEEVDADKHLEVDGEGGVVHLDIVLDISIPLEARHFVEMMMELAEMKLGFEAGFSVYHPLVKSFLD